MANAPDESMRTVVGRALRKVAAECDTGVLATDHQLRAVPRTLLALIDALREILQVLRERDELAITQPLAVRLAELESLLRGDDDTWTEPLRGVPLRRALADFAVDLREAADRLADPGAGEYRAMKVINSANDCREAFRRLSRRFESLAVVADLDSLRRERLATLEQTGMLVAKAIDRWALPVPGTTAAWVWETMKDRSTEYERAMESLTEFLHPCVRVVECLADSILKEDPGAIRPEGGGLRFYQGALGDGTTVFFDDFTSVPGRPQEAKSPEEALHIVQGRMRTLADVCNVLAGMLIERWDGLPRSAVWRLHRAVNALVGPLGQLASHVGKIEPLLAREPNLPDALRPTLDSEQRIAKKAWESLKQLLPEAEQAAGPAFMLVRREHLAPLGWESHANGILQMCRPLEMAATDVPWGYVSAEYWKECTEKVQGLRDELRTMPIPISAMQITSAEAPPNGSSPMPEFEHAEDFTWIIWKGERYSFTKGIQAEAVRALWAEWARSGRRDGCGLSEKTIGEKVGTSSDNFRLLPNFRDHPAWGKVICEVYRGVYALYAEPPGP